MKFVFILSMFKDTNVTTDMEMKIFWENPRCVVSGSGLVLFTFLPNIAANSHVTHFYIFTWTGYCLVSSFQLWIILDQTYS